jgi:signal transduction histidine kinase
MNLTRFRDISIKRKLTLIIMLTATAALIMTSSAFLAYELVRFRDSMKQHISSLAEIIGTNSTAALTFKDVRAAEETLGALKAEAHVISAAIFTHDGKAFAKYTRRGQPDFSAPPLRADGYYFTRHHMELFQAITFDGERIGTIYFRSSLEELYSRMQQYAGIVALVMIASLFVAFFVSSRLQRLVSGPILHLASIARLVSQEKDYSVRAQQMNRDELGTLTDGFNEMLAQIQQRDDALQKAHDGREARVAQRTEELRKEIDERKRAGEELEKALKVKDEFLAVMSHELRTPLNIIMGYAKVLQDKMLGDVNEQQGKSLGKIMRCSTELLSLFNDILEATRIEADKVKINWQPVPVSELIDGLQSLYSIPSDEGPALEWDYPPDLPVITSDSTKLKQILQNLINNALKFTEAGSVVVSARSVGTPGKPQAVEFKVSDTGIGIPKEKLPMIFEMFRQVDSSATRPQGGVGLGLFIVKEFAGYLEGDILVQSEVGRGSTFTLTLPDKGRAEISMRGE